MPPRLRSRTRETSSRPLHCQQTQTSRSGVSRELNRREGELATEYREPIFVVSRILNESAQTFQSGNVCANVQGFLAADGRSTPRGQRKGRCDIDSVRYRRSCKVC